MSSRTDHRFYSHYQSQNDSIRINKIDPDLVLKYLSPPNHHKSAKFEKENVNLYDEVTNLLKKYKQHPLKKKQSLPTQETRFLRDVCQQLKSHKIKDPNSKQASSTSPLTHKKLSKPEGVNLSPILKGTIITSPKGKSKNLALEIKKYPLKSIQNTEGLRCSQHPNKKAKFFDTNKNFFCSDCSIKKLLRGSLIYPLADHEFNHKHRNFLSESELAGRKELNQNSQAPQISSISRANFWSIDENSLLSSAPLMFDQKKSETFQRDTFESSLCEVDMEELIKQRELSDFIGEMEMIKQITERQTQEMDSQQWRNQFRSTFKELQCILNSLSKQVNALISQMNSLAQPVQANHAKLSQEITKEINTILSDISSNKENIIGQMQLKPFRFILSKYREKMQNYNNQLQKYQQVHLSVLQKQNELQATHQYLYFIKDQIIQKFNINLQNFIESTPQSCSDQFFNFDEDEMPSTQRNLSKRPSTKKVGIPVDHVYISFENKDLFMAAQRVSLQKFTDQQLQKPSPQNSCIDMDTVQIESVDHKRHTQENNKAKSYMLESPNFLRG